MEANAVMSGESDAPSPTSEQYLTFLLEGEEYGVDILRVQEVRGWESATPLPNSPAYVRGVINLRGLVIPIVDLRLRFGMPPVDYTKMTVVIVLRLQAEGRSRVVGVVVDGVSDVLDVAVEQRKAAPEVGRAGEVSFVRGMATIAEKMVILLEVDHLLDEVNHAVPAGTAH